jgi:DNA invertase Pin-like site-specific DNA recombinase
MITFSYIRVSGKGQVDGDGPDRQRDSIQKYCRANNISEPRQEFFEAGVSGTIEALDRPQFSAMLSAIEAAQPEAVCIVVERLDRLGRTLLVSEILLGECRARKITVYSSDQAGLVDMASDGADPARDMMRQILGAVAQFQKSELVLKLRKARERVRAEKGRCEGPIPYGSTPAEDGALKILQTFQAGGQSMAYIAEHANQMGLRTRKGMPWTKGAVYQVLVRRKLSEDAGVVGKTDKEATNMKE